jgi:aldose sugar dehydrogenase
MFTILILYGVLSFVLFVLFFALLEIANASVAEERNYPESALSSPLGPSFKDPTLMAELFFKGLSYPTDMEFLDQDDILVTEKDTGIIRRIVNGIMLQHPLLDVNVATYGHRGMLGIDTDIHSNDTLGGYKIGHERSQISDIPPLNNSDIENKYIFLFYTAAQKEDSEDITQGKQPLGNVVYRYEFVNNELINPKLLLNLPASPGAIGNGGKILFNPNDKNLYVTIGGVGVDAYKTKTQNFNNGKEPNGTSGILVINQNGGAATTKNGILGNKEPLNKYYAYGIWNSFGIDFDPITGNLWDTENGVIYGDEINLVYPGFNSGWNKVDGIWLRGYTAEDAETHVASNQTLDGLLVDFNGRGKYSPPEFTWFNDVAPTSIKFLNSDKLGKEYENDIFVGDILNGNIYHFDLNKERTDLLFPTESPYSDKIVSSNETRLTDEIVFAEGFGGVTDIEIGPKDGYLYILTFEDREGAIYRIVPNIDF